MYRPPGDRAGKIPLGKIELPETKKPRIAPGAARYRAGRGFEYDVRDELEARGFFVVRAAGSCGVADLVALGQCQQHQVLLVQCKRDGRCPPREWNPLYDIAFQHQAIPLIAMQGERTGEILYRLLTGVKVPGGPRSPWEPFIP